MQLSNSLDEALDKEPIDPNPETQRTLLKWLQPEIEKHPEIQYRLKGLQDEKAEPGF